MFLSSAVINIGASDLAVCFVLVHPFLGRRTAKLLCTQASYLLTAEYVGVILSARTRGGGVGGGLVVVSLALRLDNFAIACASK